MTRHTIAENICLISPLPDIAYRINLLIGLKQGINDNLEQVILHDAALTARILNL